MSARKKIVWFTLALIFALVANSRADFATDFDAGNKLYEQGHFDDAARAYDKLLASGKVSAALYFNRGNAFFKLGQLGRAIASYRQAQLLAPRDSAARSNLQFTRTRARGGSQYRGDRWRYWLTILSLNEWTALTAIALWMVFVLLALRQWRPQLKEQLSRPLFVAGVAVVILGAFLAVVVAQVYFTTSAIVVAGEAEVRNGPLDESPSLFKVRDGMELEVVDRKDNWLQVTDSAQRTGWLRQDEAIVFEPAAQKSGTLNLR